VISVFRRPNGQLTLEEAIRRYLVYFRNEFGATERTYEDYKGVLRRLTRAFPDSLLEEWEPPAGTETLREFIDTLWGDKTGGTRGKVTSVFKSFFKYASDNDLLVGDPAAKLKRPKRRGTQRRAHDPQDIRAILKAQPLLRDRIGISLMARLGLRKNELRLLRFENIDLPNRHITIRGKGGKVAQIPMVAYPSLLDELKLLVAQEQPESSDFLIHPVRGPGADGAKPYEPSSMHRWWQMCLKRADVPHFPMHELRHTAATVYLRATGDLEQTRMFMRHESVATTQIYSHLLQDDLIKGMEKAVELWDA
jgi:integrase